MTPVRIRLLAGALSLCCAAAAAVVEFPGPPPGPAKGHETAGIWTLENDVLAAAWTVEGGALRPHLLANKLTGSRLDQSGAEAFRLATQVATTTVEGVYVAVRLEADRALALASRDGVAWTELASFPRSDFAGEPRWVRFGKMDLKAQPKDNPGDRGAEGAATIADLTPPFPEIPGGRLAVQARAHEGRVTECAFPTGAKAITCRIDKGTDRGMSWGPALALVWEDGRKFLLVGVREKPAVINVISPAGEQIHGARLMDYPTFDLPASAFRLATPPRLVRLAADPAAVRIAERAGGMAIEADLVSGRGYRARWRAELRDGAGHLRQTLDLSCADAPLPLAGLELLDVRLPDARTIGAVPGCPVAGAGLYLGVEMPGAQNALADTGARIGFASRLTLSPQQPYHFGAVIGIAPEGQLRRAFLSCIERERARPSQPFLHYNCWYDLGYGLDEAKLLDVARSFDAELVKKRGVPVRSYLADDGWDDPGKGLWIENTNRFPQGFAGLNAKLREFGAHLSVWISPLGGYGGDKERTAWARKMGLIPPDSALDLAQPAYKKWFQERCLALMRDAGVNAFKWDKAGAGVTPHFMALLEVARALRRQDPEVFINVTAGTWPSPFWLNHIDSTWRDGSSDVGWAGVGNDREQWLTFRDGYCRRLFVVASPLYPLNSAMHHGVVHGRCFQGDKVGKSGTDLKNEARSYFANGAMLQELYLTPSMMTSSAWDRVAEAATWAHARADILADAHWVGGDPLKLEPYGYAAWSPRGATLMVRNPADRPQAIALDAAPVFELPAGAPRRWALRSPYADQRVQRLDLEAGRIEAITLEPFEVLVFDAKSTR